MTGANPVQMKQFQNIVVDAGVKPDLIGKRNSQNSLILASVMLKVFRIATRKI
jgi:hypothetical protein